MGTGISCNIVMLIPDFRSFRKGVLLFKLTRFSSFHGKLATLEDDDFHFRGRMAIRVKWEKIDDLFNVFF